MSRDPVYWTVRCCNSCLFVFEFFLIHFVVRMGPFPMGNSRCFSQEKLPATESRYPTLVINYEVHVGSFRVFVIHRTRT